MPFRLYTLPYWSNPPFFIVDILALWRSVLSARAPECQQLKNGGLDQYGAKPFEQQQLETAGVEGVKGQNCQLVTLGHPGLTYIFNFWHTGTLALSCERQSARMSDINGIKQF